MKWRELHLPFLLFLCHWNRPYCMSFALKLQCIRHMKPVAYIRYNWYNTLGLSLLTILTIFTPNVYYLKLMQLSFSPLTSNSFAVKSDLSNMADESTNRNSGDLTVRSSTCAQTGKRCENGCVCILNIAIENTWRKWNRRKKRKESTLAKSRLMEIAKGESLNRARGFVLFCFNLMNEI